MAPDGPLGRSSPVPAEDAAHLAMLRRLEQKILWLASWTIHHANHIRPARDGLKVGGHQASCASVATLMTALYLDILRPEDRVAVKPHAGPVFHAIQYLLGRTTRERLEGFRAFGGTQPYPSRTRDGGDVDFSTGSVGLGVAITNFAALVQDYVRLKGLAPNGSRPGRMVAVVGDAELDEGNIYEALLESWKHDIQDVWWLIDYNRQSLDSIVPDRLFHRIEGLFRDMRWDVVTLKYGQKLEAAFTRPGGEALRAWIDDCPNSVYSALTFQGGAAWREALVADLGRDRRVRGLIDPMDDAALAELMTNLGGHDMETVLKAMRTAAAAPRPTAFIAYTIKGMGLPLAGHKDNHAGLMTVEQMEGFRASLGVAPGEEWAPFAGFDAETEGAARRFLASVPFAAPLAGEGETRGRRRVAAAVPVPAVLPAPRRAPGRKMSTQEAFGQILSEIGRGQGDLAPLAARILTTSPDVTVSTSLGPWVNRRGVFSRHRRNDVFRDQKVASAQKWVMTPDGQHVELGIAEQNLFLLLAAAGLSHDLNGVRLIPVGTVYDTFVQRGLDALFYGCYQDARFLLVSTPSGITLAPEGGQHQSVYTPLIGIGQDRLAFYEPAHVDELGLIMAWAFRHMQAPEGSSVWLRLSTRPLAQPERVLTEAEAAGVIAGAYWRIPPAPGASLAIAYQGPVAAEAEAAHAALAEEVPGLGLLAVTSPDRLHATWLAATRARREGRAAEAPVERLLAPLAPGAGLVTVLDGHPATLGWLGAVRGMRVQALGVDRFGQTGDIPALYRAYGLDEEAIIDAAAAALLG
jgi:pyruvate dehydrogenase E1 component